LAGTPQTPKEIAESAREQNQRLFRQFLRAADKLIIEHQFDEAKIQIAEAKKIDANNPFIIAFEERIALFEQKKNPKAPAVPAPAPPHAPAAHPETPKEEAKAPPTVTVHVPEHTPATHQMLEEKVRHEVESEFRAKFTQELRKAEEMATKMVLEERAKLEEHRRLVKAQHDEQLAAARKQLEEEFKQKAADEVVKAEQSLDRQYKSELTIIEEEVKKRLAEQQEAALRNLEERVRKEEQMLLEKERQLFKEREQKLKEDSDKKLLEALRKTETVFREQNVQQQQLEKEEIRQQIEASLRSAHEKEIAELQRQFDAAKTSLQESFHEEQKRLAKENEQKAREQIEAASKRQAEEFDAKKAALREEIESELRKTYEEQLATERKRIQDEGARLLEQERKRLEQEYETLLKSQNDRIQKVRSELRTEMESVFLNKLQRVAEEYDHKMELLGVKVPESAQERSEMYREKMRACYGSGQPTVNDARMLMQLKELLELTFDEHLAIESDVRMNLYVQNVEKRILAGEMKLQMKEGLDNLKQQFGITSEEAARLEPYILSSFERMMTKGRLLVVDDDLLLLQTLEHMLTDYGFQVVIAEDIATALEKLQTTAFDFILSDIKFDYDEMDGFKFFKAVQEQPQLRSIPFVFMSSLGDGVIIRSGMQLGIDDYLTKPMDPDLLIAVIEGKLKRFRHFQKN